MFHAKYQSIPVSGQVS